MVFIFLILSALIWNKQTVKQTNKQTDRQKTKPANQNK